MIKFRYWWASLPIARQSSFQITKNNYGHLMPDYQQDAVCIPNRKRRLTMYRQADRQLVIEQVLILPIFSLGESDFIKPG
jgi:hypothetical protein